jgi:hypothetical protein
VAYTPQQQHASKVPVYILRETLRTPLVAFRRASYRAPSASTTSPRGLAVTDAPKWVCAARRLKATNHAPPLELRLHPYPNLQAAPFGLGE